MATRRRWRRVLPFEVRDLDDYLRDHYVTEDCILWATFHNFTIEDEKIRRAATRWLSLVRMYATTWPKLFQPEHPESFSKSELRVIMYKNAADRVETDLLDKARRSNATEDDLYNFLRIVSP